MNEFPQNIKCKHNDNLRIRHVCIYYFASAQQVAQYHLEYKIFNVYTLISNICVVNSDISCARVRNGI